MPIRTTAGLVYFVDGRAVVEAPELAAALREVPAVFGITEEPDIQRREKPLVVVEGAGTPPSAPSSPRPKSRGRAAKKTTTQEA
ncbi:hypothetical protein [Planomonospora venezuelensis]|uniref:Uncharacterized protein n=1 Tax=Planomonospora venezuelensis TaxID=1999 RepID=A0A841D6F2_PLAVE|nr:hypothetical protein [Planomonospora venezuelensis]MBB5965059.1 hypothetical protein [Planomonospora venezuelensis]